ncbi:MAG: DoxX family protein [Tabrizicola sp.]|nr:DoxX family protein [Tabrizicola sp.]
MTALLSLYHRAAAGLDASAGWILPTAARLVFAGVLLAYFWGSAMTKVGEGLFSPSIGAYSQIFPKVFEAAGYDPGQMGGFATLVVLAGTWAEFLLPALLVIGLMTRFAALGMVGFVIMQSLTDIYGHSAGPETVGAWFDRVSDALILDQRAFWMLLFLILIVRGAGPLSLDRLFGGARTRLAA